MNKRWLSEAGAFSASPGLPVTEAAMALKNLSANCKRIGGWANNVLATNAIR
jgi:hypothetical protein